jgi:acetyl-CoA carboxylase beta subunit
MEFGSWRLDGPRRRREVRARLRRRGRARRAASSPVTASGGARMQEGILSLMQLPKTVCAVEDLHDSAAR